MLGIILAGIIIAAVAGFIIWKPWIDLWDYLKQMKEAGGSLSKNIGTICGLSKFLLIPALLAGLIVLYCYFAGHHEHAFTETIVRAATCEEEGVVLSQCRYCDYQYEKQLPTIAHKYEETNRIASTCKEQGAIISTCKMCDDVKTEAIPLIAHKYEETNRTASTCKEQGVIVSTCKVCGDVKTEAIPLIAHKYEETNRTAPTCIKQGAIISTCKICGDVKTEAIPVIAHKYEETDRTAPTCIEQGAIISTCKMCGDVKTEAIPLIAHKYEEVSRTDSTCTNQGTSTHVCAMCKDTKTEAIPLAEHTYVEVERVAPNCLEAGRVIFRCQTCGGEKTETLPSGGEHQFKASLLNADDHTIVYVCGNCGTEKTESFSPEDEESIWSKFEGWEDNKRKITKKWEVEENGEPGTATPVADFSQVTASLSSPNDSDCFSFIISGKSDMRFDFSHEGDSIYAYYWDAAIYGTDGVTVIKQGGISHKEKGEIYTFEVANLEPGTYYIKISPAVGGNPLLNGFSNALYHITFRSRCVSHNSVKTFLLKEPTCLEGGEYINVCSECEEQISTGVIEAFGHKWGEWHNLMEAKILSKGEKERKCLICGAVERNGFLHPLSIIIMIVVALILIVFIVGMFINEEFLWMVVVIVIGIFFGIFCWNRFFVETKPETTDESTQQSFNAYAGDLKPISIAWAEASSERITEGHTIPIADTYDGDLDTCWQDGVDGDGEGEILTYYFEHPCYVVGMDIVNGRVITENKYYENNRIRSMTLYYLRDGDVTATVQLKDIEDVYSREVQYHTLASEKKDEAYYCDAIKIVIDSVYKGSVYKDLCLTEIRFYEGFYK